MDILENLKLFYGIAEEDESKDSFFEALIDEAKADAMAYCNLTVYNNSLNSTVSKMARYKKTQIGAEGLSAQSYSGVSESLLSDYPADIYKALNRFKKVRTL